MYILFSCCGRTTAIAILPWLATSLDGTELPHHLHIIALADWVVGDSPTQLALASTCMHTEKRDCCCADGGTPSIFRMAILYCIQLPSVQCCLDRNQSFPVSLLARFSVFSIRRYVSCSRLSKLVVRERLAPLAPGETLRTVHSVLHVGWVYHISSFFLGLGLGWGWLRVPYLLSRDPSSLRPGESPGPEEKIAFSAFARVAWS